ncbi:CbxX/CfqX family protein [Streptococcus pneumoniae]|nr:CbxX/CfqX family protein [Streptococcus pneumoniae]
MKYFEVELENPDEFLKLQTEDFVKANRLLLRKIIQSVTVYEENFVISFKSGIEPKFQVEVSHPKEIHLATCSPSIF